MKRLASQGGAATRAMVALGLALTSHMAGVGVRMDLRIKAQTCRLMRAFGAESRIPKAFKQGEEKLDLLRSLPKSDVDPIVQGKRFAGLRRDTSVWRGYVDGAWALFAKSDAVNRICKVDDEALTQMQHAYQGARAQGTGIIVAFPHAGSMAVNSHFLAASNIPTTVVAFISSSTHDDAKHEKTGKKIRSALSQIKTGAWHTIIDNGTRRAVQQCGAELISVNGNDGDAVLRACKDALGRGRAVLIGSDVYLGKSGGVRVNIAGSPRVAGPGPAMLSIATGAPIVTLGSFQRYNGFEVKISSPINAPRSVARADYPREVRRLTHQVAKATEQMLLPDATQWHHTSRIDNANDRGSQLRQRANERDAADAVGVEPDVTTNLAAARTPIPERPEGEVYRPRSSASHELDRGL